LAQALSRKGRPFRRVRPHRRLSGLGFRCFDISCCRWRLLLPLRCGARPRRCKGARRATRTVGPAAVFPNPRASIAKAACRSPCKYPRTLLRRWTRTRTSRCGRPRCLAARRAGWTVAAAPACRGPRAPGVPAPAATRLRRCLTAPRGMWTAAAAFAYQRTPASSAPICRASRCRPP